MLVSAGFDAHEDDPLAEMRVTEDGFRELARRCARARRRASRAVLEGGYELETLPAASSQAALDGFVAVEQRKGPFRGPFAAAHIRRLSLARLREGLRCLIR